MSSIAALRVDAKETILSQDALLLEVLLHSGGDQHRQVEQNQHEDDVAKERNDREDAAVRRALQLVFSLLHKDLRTLGHHEVDQELLGELIGFNGQSFPGFAVLVFFGVDELDRDVLSRLVGLMHELVAVLDEELILGSRARILPIIQFDLGDPHWDRACVLQHDVPRVLVDDVDLATLSFQGKLRPVEIGT